MNMQIKHIRIFSKKRSLGTALFLLFFSAPVISLQHSLCYITECPSLISSVDIKSGSDLPPCHQKQKSESKNDNTCNSGDSCLLQASVSSPDSEAVHFNKIQFQFTAFEVPSLPDAGFFKITHAAELPAPPGRYASRLYIQKQSFLI